MEHETVKITCGTETVNIDKRATNVCKYFDDFAALGSTEFTAPAGVTPEHLHQTVNFYLLENFGTIVVHKVRSNDLRESIGEKHAKFLQDLGDAKVKSLFTAVMLLRATELIDACAAYFAVKIYFKNQDMDGYAKRKAENGVTGEITIEDSKNYAVEFSEILGH